MRLTGWLSGVRAGLVRLTSRSPFSGATQARRQRRVAPRPEFLESRVVLAEDFGDAPDSGPGTGRGNYQTLLSDNGPRHTIDAGTVLLGALADGEGDGQPNTRADGDDRAQSDDEDGVRNLDQLEITTGTQPVVTLSAMNGSGTAATLYGWIDFNADGVFDNATERAQVTVPDAFNSRVRLTFPVVPAGYTGTTYARFRISTDVAAANPTGLASNGEVEDYAVTIFAQGTGTVKSSLRLDTPSLTDNGNFGRAIASLGDLDGDGVKDLAVGAPYDSTVGGQSRGAVHILFMNADQTVKTETLIASGLSGGPFLGVSNGFGRSIANIGDIDGDGIVDLAVGAFLDGTGGSQRGVVYLLRLNRDGTVKSKSTITGTSTGVADGDQFGTSLASVDDLDGDGNKELAVGVPGSDLNGSGNGAVQILFLGANGAVKKFQPIGSNFGGGPVLANGGQFGFSLANLGKLSRFDTDYVTALAVGAVTDNTGGNRRGAVYVLFIQSDGTANSSFTKKIAHQMNGGPSLNNIDQFGQSLASIGDINGDNFPDLAVGADGVSTEGLYRGSAYILLLTFNGTVKTSFNPDDPTIVRIGSGVSGGPTLENRDYFGAAVANLGDIDGDGRTDIAVGAGGDDTGGNFRGAVHVLRISSFQAVKTDGATKIASGATVTVADGDNFGAATVSLGDLDGDGVNDLAVGSPGATLAIANEAAKTGSLRILLMNRSGGVKFSRQLGNGLSLPTNAYFGSSIANLGDINGDGVVDLAVGSPGDYNQRGAVYILLLNANGTLKASTKLASGVPGMPSLVDGDRFGTSVAAILKGSGRIAVGASGDSFVRGAVYAVSLAPNSINVSVLGFKKITTGSSGGPDLPSNAGFGSSVAGIGDVDGDGIEDLAVGATREDSFRGALYVLLLNIDLTVKNSNRLASQINGMPRLASSGLFGNSVTALGDFDGDGFPDLAVGASYDDAGGASRGAIYILGVAPGAARSVMKIGSGIGQGPNTPNFSLFGSSVALIGDQDGDGVRDLAVGASGDRIFGTIRGTVYVLRLNAAPNAAPILDPSGNPFAILGVGSRQSTEMRQGTPVGAIFAGQNPISDADVGAKRGIAVIAADTRFGTFQYTLSPTNPAENSWVDFGAVSNGSALLLPTDARIRFTTSLLPHHTTGAPFLPLESKLDTGLTFRAWDQTSGVAGAKADTTTNGGASAFSIATETAKVYFETRLFRSFNTVAGLNIYTLEAEFNALTTNPLIVDRATAGFTGFTILMSAVPELGTAPLYRSYFGVQFNGDGTETDMGYRYLTTDINEAAGLENLGPANKRPTREGAYFREVGDPKIPGDKGVNNGTAILGYIFSTQQPGTAQMTQVYRTDNVGKPTRPPGTAEGSTPNSTRQQEQGDHVYTTNTGFETGRPGTWRVEANRGFVRELTPNPTGVGPVPPAVPAVSVSESPLVLTVLTTPESIMLDAGSTPSPLDGVARLIALPPTAGGDVHAASPVSDATAAVPGTSWDSTDEGSEEVVTYDDFFADAEWVGASGWGV